MKKKARAANEGSRREVLEDKATARQSFAYLFTPFYPTIAAEQLNSIGDEKIRPHEHAFVSPQNVSATKKSRPIFLGDKLTGNANFAETRRNFATDNRGAVERTPFYRQWQPQVTFQQHNTLTCFR